MIRKTTTILEHKRNDRRILPTNEKHNKYLNSIAKNDVKINYHTLFL